MSRSRSVVSPVLAVLVALSSLVSLMPRTGLAQAEDFAAAGLVSDTEYLSPQHGYEITWDDAWGVDPDRVDPVLWNKPDLDRHGDIPVYTTDLNLYDRLDLWLPGLDARFRVIAQANAGGTVHLPSMSAPNTSLGGDADVLIEIDDPDESVVVHRHAMNDGSLLISYNELVPSIGQSSWLWIQLVAPERDFADAFARAGTDIESDIFTFGGLVTADEILAASAANPAVPVSEWGITSATSWSCPPWDVEITWSGNFTTFENLNGIRDADVRFWLTFGPKFGDPWTIETGVFANDDNETIDDLYARTVAAYEAQERIILISTVVGNRAIFLWQSVSGRNVFVHYTEYGISNDGEAILWAEMQGQQVDEGPAFVPRFAVAVGAVTIDGIPFGDSLDPAVIIAAANTPVED